MSTTFCSAFRGILGGRPKGYKKARSTSQASSLLSKLQFESRFCTSTQYKHTTGPPGTPGIYRFGRDIVSASHGILCVLSEYVYANYEQWKTDVLQMKTLHPTEGVSVKPCIEQIIPQPPFERTSSCRLLWSIASVSMACGIDPRKITLSEDVRITSFVVVRKASF